MILKDKHKRCARCTETLLPDHIDGLCDECYKILGPKPEKYSHVCYVCGLTWAPNNVCRKCLIEDYMLV